jgi:Ca2+-binding RTX toxin-like protein
LQEPAQPHDAAPDPKGDSMTRLRTLLAFTFAVVLASTTMAVAAPIEGTDGPDGLVGTPARDRIDARAGDDVVFGLGGDDKIKAGKGDDDVDGDGQCPPGATDPSYCEHGGGGDHCDDKGAKRGHGDHCDDCDDKGGKRSSNGHNGHGDHGCDHHGHHGGCPPGTKDPTYCENVDGDDIIKAGRGDDTVRGAGGDDKIGAGHGNDDVDAGRGDDKVFVRDGDFDTVDCGSGFDKVIADRFDDVARNCERVSRPHGGGHH